MSNYQNMREALDHIELIGLPHEMAKAAANAIKKHGVDRLLSVHAPTDLRPWVGLTFEHTYVGIGRTSTLTKERRGQ